MIDQDQTPDRNPAAVIEAFLAQTREGRPGRLGPRVALAVVAVILGMASAVLIGYLTRPASHHTPAPTSSLSGQGGSGSSVSPAPSSAGPSPAQTSSTGRS